MKYQLLKFVFCSLIAYSASAQSVLNLLDAKTAQIESYNGKNELTGSGMLVNDKGRSHLRGSLTGKTGQKIAYSNQFGFSQNNEGLEVDFSFYLNPFSYSPNLEVSYDGDKVLFPVVFSQTVSLREVNGTFIFLLKGKPFMEERGRLFNRKVSGSEKLEFMGEVFECFVINSTYQAQRIRKGSTISETTEYITEWYLPEKGIIKSQRKGIDQSVVFKLK